VLRALAINMFLLLAFIAVDNVALVFLVRETLGGSAFAYGVIEAVFGLGMLAGTFWILRGGGGGWTATRLYVFACGLSVGGSFGGAVAPDIPVLGGFEALAGAGNGIEVVAMETIIQQQVPRSMVGRVYGFVASATSLGLGVSMGLGGLLVDATSRASPSWSPHSAACSRPPPSPPPCSAPPPPNRGRLNRRSATAVV
jgi:MFS family permease